MDIVLGDCEAGRLFVVLPTGVRAPLPFACNAPFLQDPARERIKDPATSPANQWLLKRAGELAADALTAWLDDENLPEHERAAAYDLMPGAGKSDDPLANDCADRVRAAFDEHLGPQPALALAAGGALQHPMYCEALPPQTLEIWTPCEVEEQFCDWPHKPLSRHISQPNREKLAGRGVTEKTSREVLDRLMRQDCPRPRELEQLLRLWAWLGPEMASDGFPEADRKKVRIVPAEGKPVLVAAEGAVRVKDADGAGLTDDDLSFLSPWLTILDRKWTAFLEEPRESEDGAAALRLLNRLGFATGTGAKGLVEQAASAFFAGKDSPDRSACVRITRLAARVNAGIAKTVRYYTRDGRCQPAGHPVLHDRADTALLPDEWLEAHTLHPDYGIPLGDDCPRDTWETWSSASDRSGLLGFAPLKEQKRGMVGESVIKEIALSKGEKEPGYLYPTVKYDFEDWDYEDELWRHWEGLSGEIADVWARVVEMVLAHPAGEWKEKHEAKVINRYRKTKVGSMTAAWVCRLREKKCLRDTHGPPREPQELLRRTPQTEALMGVEPFVAAGLDRPETQGLLDALGVRNTPTGPEGILNLLRALARAAAPRADEVDKWHARLDTLVQQGTTEDLDTVRRAFGQDRLILAERGGWHSPKDVFITADEDEAPGAPLLRPEVRDLALWEKIGVRRRPTTEVVLEQLKGLEAFKPLKKEDADRVRRLLKRHARRVWEDLGHWVTPDNQWMPVEAFSHTRRKKDLEVASLFSAVLGKTADLSFLGEEDAAALPAAGLTALEDALSFRPEGAASGDDSRPPWMGALGRELARAVFDDADEQERVRTAARRLTATVLHAVGKLTVVPCLSGEPAGPPQPKRAVWDGEVLHVERGSPAGLARPVCDELARAFAREEITRLLPLCYDRPAKQVVEYVRDQVRQDEAEAPVPVQAAPVPCELPMLPVIVPPADAPP
ncbi:MAG TPA: hypothetical protein PLI98_15235, partial [Candidatus Hydrogenedentes bacterium]|nr:hypothetical protein [Candidatus Hydrogenedentota bacterium]